VGKNKARIGEIGTQIVNIQQKLDMLQEEILTGVT